MVLRIKLLIENHAVSQGTIISQTTLLYKQIRVHIFKTFQIPSDNLNRNSCEVLAGLEPIVASQNKSP